MNISGFSLVDLPVENVYEVMQRVSFEDIRKFCAVSPYLRIICQDVGFWRSRSRTEFDITPETYNRLLSLEIPRLETIYGNMDEIDKYVYIITRVGHVTYGSETYLHPTVAFVRALTQDNRDLINYIADRSSTIDLASTSALHTLLFNGGETVVDSLNRLIMRPDGDMYSVIDIFPTSDDAFNSVSYMIDTLLPMRSYIDFIFKVVYPRADELGRRLLGMATFHETNGSEFKNVLTQLDATNRVHMRVYISIAHLLGIYNRTNLFQTLVDAMPPQDIVYNRTLYLALWYGHLDFFQKFIRPGIEGWMAFGAVISGRDSSTARVITELLEKNGTPPDVRYLTVISKEGETQDGINLFKSNVDYFLDPGTSEDVRNILVPIFQESLIVAGYQYHMVIFDMIINRLSNYLDASTIFTSLTVNGNLLATGEILKRVNPKIDHSAYYIIAADFSREPLLEKMIKEQRKGQENAIIPLVKNDNAKMLSLFAQWLDFLPGDSMMMAIKWNSNKALRTILRTVGAEPDMLIYLLKVAIQNANEDAIKTIFEDMRLGYDFVDKNPSLLEDDPQRALTMINRALSEINLK